MSVLPGAIYGLSYGKFIFNGTKTNAEDVTGSEGGEVERSHSTVRVALLGPNVSGKLPVGMEV